MKNSRHDLLNSLWEQILRGQGDLVHSQIPDTEGMSTEEKRHRAHLFAKICLFRGESSEALALLQEAEKNFGPHLLNRLDQLTCHYHRGEFAILAPKTAKLEEEIPEFDAVLSDETRRSAALFLAKINEELGLITKALHHYSVYEKTLAGTEFDRSWLDCQRLRLSAQFKIGEDFFAHYYQLKTRYSEISSENYRCEEIHALLLAEEEAFGIRDLTAALEPYRRLLQNSLGDWELVVFDLLEIRLRKQTEITADLREWVRSLKPQSQFQEMLIQVLNQEVEKPWDFFVATYTPDSLLRILHLLARCAWYVDREIAGQIKLKMMARLSLDDQRIWRNFFNEKDSEIAITRRDKQIFTAGGHLIFEATTTIDRFLELVLKGRSNEEVAHALWDTSLTHHEYNRMKRLADRVNLGLRKNGYPPLITVSKNQIRVAAPYRIAT